MIQFKHVLNWLLFAEKIMWRRQLMGNLVDIVSIQGLNTISVQPGSIGSRAVIRPTFKALLSPQCEFQGVFL
jgi:hypothetical protein